MSWRPRQVVIEKDDTKGEGRLNCSRITACADGTLLLVVDFFPPGRGEWQENPCENLLFRSTDSGRTWTGPQETGIQDGVVPAIKELANGDLLIGVTRMRMPKNMDWRQALKHGTEEQTVYISSDKGRRWEGPFAVPGVGRLRLNEGDFAQLDDGTVVCYMREDAEKLSGWKSISRDGGRTWCEPIRTEMFSCRGRPSVGRLRSGEVLITYRFCSGVSTSLALYMETAEEALRVEPPDPTKYDSEYKAGRFAFIDNDRSLHPDSGYSGWVQLPSGSLYVVNYITDNAPMAQIRGYLLSREDFYLFPEGDIRWLHPAHGRPYVEQTAEMARKQFQENRRRDWSKRVPTQK